MTADVKPASCRGKGESRSPHGTVKWQAGDIFVVPGAADVVHYCTSGDIQNGSAALYWITDEPLCKCVQIVASGWCTCLTSLLVSDCAKAESLQ